MFWIFGVRYNLTSLEIIESNMFKGGVSGTTSKYPLCFRTLLTITISINFQKHCLNHCLIWCIDIWVYMLRFGVLNKEYTACYSLCYCLDTIILNVISLHFSCYFAYCWGGIGELPPWLFAVLWFHSSSIYIVDIAIRDISILNFNKWVLVRRHPMRSRATSRQTQRLQLTFRHSYVEVHVIRILIVSHILYVAFLVSNNNVYWSICWLSLVSQLHCYNNWIAALTFGNF